jgi:hypothetical protein
LEYNCKTSSPFNLNCWKHHAGFIAKQISKIKKEEELKSLPAILIKIGGSQMDLYLGKLTPLQITDFTEQLLKGRNVIEYESYKKWLFAGDKEYRLITLPDKSTWTLRMGKEKEKYIHIHPGRYSAHTIRVRALTLKTAIFVMAYLTIYKISSPDLQLINDARKIFFKAEPVKSLSSSSGLRRLLNVFNKL